jgi:UDP-glucuronate 4-epimerase
VRTILVTGGAGFLGSHLAEALLERGDEVAVLDNFDPFYDPSFKRENVSPFLSHPRFRLWEGDLRDGEGVGEFVEAVRPDAVVHLAALAGVRPSIEDPARYADVNVVGTVRLLEALRGRPVPLVFGSSSSVYGARERIPFREDEPCGTPESPYAATKRAGELLVHVYHRLHGAPTICLRFFTVYGPRQRPEMAIHSFARRIDEGLAVPIFGDGSSRRDYTYVDDVVRGMLAALDRCEGFQVVNLGGGRTVALSDLVESIGRALGRRAREEVRPPAPGDVPVTCADGTKARALLGFEPRVPLEEGLGRFVEWLRGPGSGWARSSSSGRGNA